MLIECPYCESKVDAKVLADINEVSEIFGIPVKTSFLQCPSCREALVSYQEIEPQGFRDGQEVWEFGDPIRVWPRPDESIHHSIPNLVKNSIEEAQKCYRAKAYDACAVMCGRAIESILQIIK